MNVLPVYMPVHQVYAWYLQRPEEGIGSHGISNTDGCERPCEYWEPNPGPLQEQHLLLTADPALRLQNNSQDSVFALVMIVYSLGPWPFGKMMLSIIMYFISITLFCCWTLS